MGVHESIIPAAVAPMAPAQRRATAYGIFTAAYGVFWFIGSAVIGVLYDVSLPSVVAFCIVTQFGAVLVFLLVACQSAKTHQ
jgi:predicted MFS family arabinose efflux permease